MENEIDDAPLSSPAFDAPKRRRLHKVLIFVLYLMTLAAYANSFRSGFPLDNQKMVLMDSRITAVTSRNLQLILSRGYWYPIETSGLYRPVTTLSYLFNYAILGNGDRPAGYHAVNLLLQLLNVALAYLLAWKVFGDFGLVFATTAVWAVHPLLTESITNIVGRADLLAGAVVLGGLLLHIHASDRIDSLVHLIMTLSLGALSTIGIFSKESVMVLPAVMALYDITFRPRLALRCCRAGYLAVLLPVVCWWSVRLLLVKAPMHPLVDNPLVGASFWIARLTAIKVIGKYLCLLVFPRTLSFDYSFNQIPIVSWPLRSWEDWQAVLAAICCVSLLVVAVKSYRRRPAIFFWIAFSFITFVPTSNLLVLIGTSMAERFMYLPAIGFAACVVAGLAAAGRRLKIPLFAPAAIVMLCLAFGFRTIARNIDWSDEVVLASSGVSAAPESFKTHWALAATLPKRNRSELETAIREIERSIRIQTNLPDSEKAAVTYILAGEFCRRRGDMEAANVTAAGPTNIAALWYRKSRDILQHAVSIDGLRNMQMRAHEIRSGTKPSRIPPFGMTGIYNQLGITYMRLQEPRRALEIAQYGRKLGPAKLDFYLLMEDAYAAVHDYEGQVITLLAEARMFPNDPRPGPMLARAYAEMDLAGCEAVSINGSRLNLNFACPGVHRQVCAAREDLVDLLLGVKEEKHAWTVWQEALDLNCHMRHFDFQDATVAKP
jgi:hypothetical protein